MYRITDTIKMNQTENKVATPQLFIKPPTKGDVIKVYKGKDGKNGHYYGIAKDLIMKSFMFGKKVQCVVIDKIDIEPDFSKINYFLEEDRTILAI